MSDGGGDLGAEGSSHSRLPDFHAFARQAGSAGFLAEPPERSPTGGKQGQGRKFAGNAKEMVISGLLIKRHPSLSSQVLKVGLGTLLCSALALRNFPAVLYSFRLSRQSSPRSFALYLSHYGNFS